MNIYIYVYMNIYIYHIYIYISYLYIYNHLSCGWETRFVASSGSPCKIGNVDTPYIIYAQKEPLGTRRHSRFILPNRSKWQFLKIWDPKQLNIIYIYNCLDYHIKLVAYLLIFYQISIIYPLILGEITRCLPGCHKTTAPLRTMATSGANVICVASISWENTLVI